MKKNNKQEENSIKKRIVMYIIILVIIVLALITSCSCTSRFLGKIGYLFRNEGNYTFYDETNDCEIVNNQELIFDMDNINMAVSDGDIKLSFTDNFLNNKNYYCYTSDPSIATCYVDENGYVVVRPKKPGNVTVIVGTEDNGKKYESSTDITITESNKYIILSNNSGTINLKKNGFITETYRLEGISGKVKVSSSDASVATAVASGGILKITGLKTGSATITLSVYYKGVTYTTNYTVKVVSDDNTNKPDKPNKPENPNPPVDPDKPNPPVDPDNPNPGEIKDKDSSLNSLTTNKGTLDPNFRANITDYVINVLPTDKDITLNAIANSSKATVTYTYNGDTTKTFNDVGLNVGENKVVITVTAEDGTKTIYNVTINRPSLYEVKLDNSSYTCELEDKYCNIKYHVYKDGEEIFDYNPSLVNLKLDEVFKGKASIGTGDKLGYIILEPDTKVMLDKTTNFEISYNNGDSTKASVTFTAKDYYLRTYKYEYYMSLDSSTDKRSIILNSDIFGASEDVTVTGNNKEIIITSTKDKNMFIKISTTSDLIDLKYNKDDNLMSLPIIVTANDEGKAFIHVVGSVFGKTVKEFDIEINIAKKYIVTLSPGEGAYSLTEDYQFKLGASDKPIDISKLDVPIMVDPNGECFYYEFLGYALKGDATETIIYRSTDVITYQDLEANNYDSEVEFVAIYNKEDKKELKNESREMWLVDVPLFHNEEYFRKYGEDKVIYPGATGEYTMYFNSDATRDIKITGMTLKEDTVCVDIDKDGTLDGCLNMGYIIKDSMGNYLYGSYNKKEEYSILNKNATSKDWIMGHNETKIDFSPEVKEKLVLKANSSDWLEITIHWQWVDFDDNGFNDKLDTAIGNYAYNKFKDTNLNTLYRLYVGINFDLEYENCGL